MNEKQVSDADGAVMGAGILVKGRAASGTGIPNRNKTSTVRMQGKMAPHMNMRLWERALHEFCSTGGLGC